MKSWLVVGCALAVGCTTKSNAKYCATTCADPSMTCDPVAHQCVPSTADLGIPDLAVDDLRVAEDLATNDLAGADLTTFDMTPPPACTVSSTCPNNLPVCDATMMVCRICSGATDDSVCAARSASTPHCKLASTNMGLCEQCNVDTDCQSDVNTPNATPACDVSGSCRACRVHSECASGVCDLTMGTCVVPANIIYVDQDRCAVNTPDGSFGAPFCQITDAFSSVNATKKYIQVAGSITKYNGSFTLGPSATTAGISYEVHLIGPGKKAPKLASIYTHGSIAITVQPNGNTQKVSAYLDGLDIIGGDNNHDAVFCSYANKTGATVSLAVRDSNTWGGDNGLEAGAFCALSSEANIIFQNKTGIVVSANSQYSIHNTIIVRNSTIGINFAGGISKGGFSFNTIGVNGTAGAEGAIDCGGAPILIEDSIVTDNIKVGGTQFVTSDISNCLLYNVVVADDTIASPNKLTGTPAYLSTSFNAPDLHLKIDDPTSLLANQDCCIDKITGPGPSPTPSPLPTTDYDLEPRPKGVSWDIGADEAL